MTDNKPERRGGPRFGNPNGKRGRPPNPTPPGTQHLRLDRGYPLPCSVRTESGICGKPAFAAIAWQAEPSGPWPTPGLWTLPPICKECAEKAAQQYNK